ncbi:MAG TPA: serine protease [Burkholderiales bacterium]|nr:serine protease [Burkholderiales bacterium]
MMRIFALGLALFLVAGSAPVRAAAPDVDAAQLLFESAKDKVLKIRVVLNATQSQAAVGSGFLVSGDGLVVTNFHVVSDFLERPAEYTVEYVRHDGRTGPLRLINVDVIHDLALLRIRGRDLPHFRLVSHMLEKGERGYSLGNPHDLGLTIVEGTYSGLITESLYEHIHFTGAINPGMSGGPAITRDGEVFGVNVSRLVEAELVSFLVPVKFVRELLAATRDESATPEALLRRARDQILGAQNATLSRLLAAPLPTAALGGYRVPASVGEFMRCWGRAEDEQTKLYRASTQICSLEDAIFVFENVRTGWIDFEHTLLESRKLGWMRFYKLYETRFATVANPPPGLEEDFTEFRCRTEFVHNDSLMLRAAICLRAYKRLPGLYDLWMRAATLDAYDHGLQTTLTLLGVSFDNGERFAQRYLEAISRMK